MTKIHKHTHTHRVWTGKAGQRMQSMETNVLNFSAVGTTFFRLKFHMAETCQVVTTRVPGFQWSSVITTPEFQSTVEGLCIECSYRININIKTCEKR